MSHSLSGTVPLLMAKPGVWQSLQPLISTRYLPRAASVFMACLSAAMATVAVPTKASARPANADAVER